MSVNVSVCAMCTRNSFSMWHLLCEWSVWAKEIKSILWHWMEYLHFHDCNFSRFPFVLYVHQLFFFSSALLFFFGIIVVIISSIVFFLCCDLLFWQGLCSAYGKKFIYYNGNCALHDFIFIFFPSLFLWHRMLSFLHLHSMWIVRVTKWKMNGKYLRRTEAL